MGLTLPFLVQDQQYMYGPRNKFSIRTRFLAPQEYVTHMLWLNYAIDLVLVWGLLLLAFGRVTLLVGCGGNPAASKSPHETGSMYRDVRGVRQAPTHRNCVGVFLGSIVR